MKIYHKRNFFSGLLMCFLGTLNLIISCVKGFEIKNSITIFFLFCIGISWVARSLSKHDTKEDLLEEKDERNQLVNLKSKAKGFRITQNFSMIVGLFFTIYGVLIKQNIIVAIGVSFLFLWTISLILEVCTFCYYEKRE